MSNITQYSALSWNERFLYFDEPLLRKLNFENLNSQPRARFTQSQRLRIFKGQKQPGLVKPKVKRGEG
ncbi:UNKNOWN [Stylonychia lemnae]|uniref:Uncharacterized protein n=1 Tax=Stylonychia lemnae TaxID=5949 RepID=A0A078A7K5_STYLE|nr:UNKNOWN [Stylonychia lemnae]|eukprot:CDW78224.1 UNKNOWN [Stylonychia lemnae]